MVLKPIPIRGNPVDDLPNLLARRTPGTATGEQLRADAQDEALCLCQLRTHYFVFY